MSNRRLSRAQVCAAGGALLAWVLASSASAQSRLWSAQLGTTQRDEARAAAPDGAGGVVVGGLTQGALAGANAGGLDAWLARYDAAGSSLWVHQLGTGGYDVLAAAAPDGVGGAFVCGYTSGPLGGVHLGDFDVWLARYDAAGSQLWIRQLGTSVDDYALAAAPDGVGGVFVGGSTEGALGAPVAGAFDAWVARFDASGSTLWIRQLGTGANDESAAVASDGAGGVLVGGTTEGSLAGPLVGSADAWLARYDGAGNAAWIVQFAVGSNARSEIDAAAPDGVGGAFVGGLALASDDHPAPPVSDAWLARFDGTGSQLWMHQLATSGYDLLWAAAPDGSGGVYVGGETFGSLGAPNAGEGDAWLARYDAAGTRLWIQQPGTSGFDEIAAAAQDGSGGVHVVGSTTGDLAGTNAGQEDAWLARYDSSCPAPSSYCVASSTSIPGCQAAIASVGSPSFAAPTGFSILSGSVPGGNLGIAFYGLGGKAAQPLGTLGGRICTQPPTFRCAPRASGGQPGSCNGQFVYTLQDLIQASPASVFPGAILRAQFWARDPANADGFLLSDALELTVCM